MKKTREEFLGDLFLRRSVPVFFLVASVVLNTRAQSHAPYILYNTLSGAVLGSVGSLINKKKEQNVKKAVFMGFVKGAAGGLVMYGGKRLNAGISRFKNESWAWGARAVYSLGNSMAENAAANAGLFSQFHFDLGFVRFEFQTEQKVLRPRLMPSFFAGFVALTLNGKFEGRASLMSGTLIFKTGHIRFGKWLTGFTSGNSILLVDSMRNSQHFYEVFAHEMIHTFHFQDHSPVNRLFNPWSSRLKERSDKFRAFSKWVYLDLNYELMLINYFLINRGYDARYYCGNFLEKEAEFLITGRAACHE